MFVQTQINELLFHVCGSLADRIASVYQSQQNHEAAREALEDAVAIHHALLEQDPRNVEHRRTDWRLRNSRASVLTSLGEYDQAESLLKQALAVEEVLLAEDSSRVADRQGVAETCHNMARICFARAVEQQNTEGLHESKRWLGRSLDAFRAIEIQSPLSAVQSHRRQDVLQMRTVIEEALSALTE